MAVDRRKTRGLHKGNQHTGVEKATSVAISKSAEETAELVGTNRGKVEKIRAIIDYAEKTGDDTDQLFSTPCLGSPI
jgi:hypothetical protein